MTIATVGKAIKSNPQISYFHSPKLCLHFTQLVTLVLLIYN